MVRHRYCISPEPEFGGADCEGDDTEVAVCEEKPCPGKYLSDNLLPKSNLLFQIIR